MIRAIRRALSASAVVVVIVGAAQAQQTQTQTSPFGPGWTCTAWKPAASTAAGAKGSRECSQWSRSEGVSQIPPPPFAAKPAVRQAKAEPPKASRKQKSKQKKKKDKGRR